ncbi:MAG: type IV toxin-antitoxin system AbiEi family antitoxin domain-containing protein, partial [Mycobacterium sp.]
MNSELDRLFDEQGGVATSAQILASLTRHAFDTAVDTGSLERLWQGIYCRGEPDDQLRLRGLDLSSGAVV